MPLLAEKLDLFTFNLINEKKMLTTEQISKLDLALHNPEVLIEITSVCNFACTYCSSPFGERKKAHMPMDLFIHIANQLPGLTKQNIRMHVDGEPTMHPNFAEMVQYLNSKDFGVSLATNGSLLGVCRS